MTTKENEGVKLPTKIRREIEMAMKVQSRSKGMEDEAKILKQSAKDILLPLLSAYDLKNYTLEGVGKTTYTKKEGSSINEANLKEAMLVEGISVKVINKIMKKAKKFWSSEFVSFKRA